MVFVEIASVSFMEYKVREIDNIKSKESMSSFIHSFRVYASNNRNNENVLNT